jgi:hypothetical protein
MNVPIEVAAYLAGVLDSDGSIGVYRNTYAMRVRGDASQPIYQARIHVKQVESGAVGLFKETFGGHLFLEKPNALRGRPLWSWSVHSAACKAVLETALPHLRIKRAQAENALVVCRLNRVQRRFEVPGIIPGEPMVTMAEAAERLGKSYAVVIQAVHKGSVPSVKVRRSGLRAPSVFIPESYLDIWAVRGQAPRRSSEVTRQLEDCHRRARELNRVGI